MVGIGVLINLNSENEGGKRRKEGRKKERKEEKLVYEGTTIMQTLIIQILRGAPTIPLAIHLPPRKFEFQEFEFLGKNFFSILSLPLSNRLVAEISTRERAKYLHYLLFVEDIHSSVSTLIISR